MAPAERPQGSRGLPQLLLVSGLGAILLGVFFGPVLFGGRTFTYRDAGHFYYPLFSTVQRAWAAGRLPLWDTDRNGGGPLLANATASVFYPGKLIFALLPFATAFKWYIVLHLVLAAGSACAMARAWGTSIPAAGLCGLSYAFGAIVLFQYSNPVFLIGAAWVPVGLIAGDRALRSGQWRWAVILGLVLTLQTLGGDPEAAYLTGGLAVVYALILVFRIPERSSEPPGQDPPFSGSRSSFLAGRFVRLALAGVVGGGLAAVQVLPSAEYAGLGDRGESGPGRMTEIYLLDLSPWRLPEFVWPNVLGHQLAERIPEHDRWIQAVYPERDIWGGSLYLGVVPLVFGLAGLRFRRAAAWQVWLSCMAVLGLWGSLGKLGGLYPLMVHALPGFSGFRFPAKLLPYTALGLSGLAAATWDRLAAGQGRGVRWSLLALGIVSGLGLAGVLGTRGAIMAWLHHWAAEHPSIYYGPLHGSSALQAMLGGLGQTAVVSFLAWAVLARPWWSRPQAGQVALLALAAVDLAVANHWLVLSDDQATIEAPPRVARIIAEAERQSGDTGPFRIYRSATYLPAAWSLHPDADRTPVTYRWDFQTLRSHYAAMFGLDDVVKRDTITLGDYLALFVPFPIAVRPELRAAFRRQFPNADPDRVNYFPRRAFDLWNTRYFILPTTLDPNDEVLGTLSLLAHCDLLDRSSSTADDVQVLRNRDCFPRAWLVHRARWSVPLGNCQTDACRDWMAQIVYAGDPLWTIPGRPVFDPRSVAWIEADSLDRLRPFVTSADLPTGPADACTIVRYEPEAVDLVVQSGRPGILVLADTFYPGWTVRVDGRAEEILRTNRMMRGVALSAGRHQVEFRYDPASFRHGLAITATTLLVLIAPAGVWLARGAWRGGWGSPTAPTMSRGQPHRQRGGRRPILETRSASPARRPRQPPR